jgi:integrase
MPSLYKPKIVTYRLPDGSYRTPNGQRVTKDTKGAVRSVERSKKWYGRFSDGAGKLQRVPLSESKEIARRMLAKLAGDAQRASVGIVDPFAEHRRRPLTEHVEDFRRFLAAKGDVAEHVQKVASQCHAVIEGCRFLYVDDLQPSAVVGFLARLRKAHGCPAIEAALESFSARELAKLLAIRVDSVWRLVRRGQLRCAGGGEGHQRRFLRQDVEELLSRRRGPGITTSNHYLASIKAFSKWLVTDRRTGSDPLVSLSRQNAEVDPRRQRRALKEEAFGRFVEATAGGASFRGIDGRDRLVIYVLSANTGFRAGELGSLTPESFDFEATPPTVTVAASYSKHRRRDVQPLRADLAEMMRGYVAGRPPGKPLWPGTWTKVAAEMVRLDLAAAGIAYQDDAGRYFDFHALRGQFISSLAAQGVHPKVAQVLARHSTFALTMKHYTHLDVFDVTGALDKLPPLPGAKATHQPTAKEARRA